MNRNNETLKITTGAMIIALFAMLRTRSSETRSSESGEETSVYVNIEQTAEDYLVFCCFTVGRDLDPMSEYNRRKEAEIARILPQVGFIK